MPWIRTLSLDDADDKVLEAMAQQRALYPPEYAQPVAELDQGLPGIVASHTLIPEALYHAFATFGALMSPELPLQRRQHEMIADHGLTDQQVPLLNCLARRVSASGHPG